MHEIDDLLRLRRVMHRAEIAERSSRATQMRRIDGGFWWRPTYRTVAPLGVRQDRGFELLTALAHTWPTGALTGPALLYALGRSPELPATIDISIAGDRRATHDGNLRLHAFDDQRVSQAHSDGVLLAVDLGPSSAIFTAAGAAAEIAAWFVVDIVGSAHSHSHARRIEVGVPILDRLRTTTRFARGPLYQAVAAAIDGCQSPGEIEVWGLLGTTDLDFSTQKRWSVPLVDRPLIRSASIYSDFWIPDLRAVLEVDSRLHDHVSDVRRDTWLRRQDVRTLRVVGSDFFTSPDAARRDFYAGLRDLGWKGRTRSRRAGRRRIAPLS